MFAARLGYYQSFLCSLEAPHLTAGPGLLANGKHGKFVTIVRCQLKSPILMMTWQGSCEGNRDEMLLESTLRLGVANQAQSAVNLFSKDKYGLCVQMDLSTVEDHDSSVCRVTSPSATTSFLPCLYKSSPDYKFNFSK